jgi:hypothetical protein
LVSPDVAAHALMLRPTRSRLVTEIDIVLARRECNLTKTKPFPVQFVGKPGFARWEAVFGWLTLEPSQRLRESRDFLNNLAGEWRGFNRGDRPPAGLLRNRA